MQYELQIELEKCRKAWKQFFEENGLPETATTFADGSPIYSWHLMKRPWCSPLTNTVESRITYVLEARGEEYASLWLSQFRPVSASSRHLVAEAFRVYKESTSPMFAGFFSAVNEAKTAMCADWERLTLEEKEDREDTYNGVCSLVRAEFSKNLEYPLKVLTDNLSPLYQNDLPETPHQFDKPIQDVAEVPGYELVNVST